MERKTKTTMKPKVGILACGNEDTEKKEHLVSKLWGEQFTQATRAPPSLTTI